MNSWGSYPSIFNLGHKAIQDLFSVPINVEEKVDGSQFSFGLIPLDDETKAMGPTFAHTDEFDNRVVYSLRVRSKGAEMIPDAPEKLFNKAVDSVKERLHLLKLGWTYRAEYLARPKHNTLMYDRVPTGHLIVFDISPAYGEFLSYAEKKEEAKRIGLECVPLLWTDEGGGMQLEDFRTFLNTTSVLGGQKVEGVVVKPRDYNLYGPDKKVLLGKFVSEAFKEIHRKAWGEANPTSKDILTRIADGIRTPARWNKAIQHLREKGEIEDSPRDIGKIIKEAQADIEKEAEEEIKDALYKWAWPHLRRASTAGLPEWYKQELLKLQFERGVL
jgi:hypothetical protein